VATVEVEPEASAAGVVEMPAALVEEDEETVAAAKVEAEAGPEEEAEAVGGGSPLSASRASPWSEAGGTR